MSSASVSQIRSIKIQGHLKTVRLVSTAESTGIVLPRFSQVSVNEKLYFSGVKDQKIWMLSSDESGKKIPIVPVFRVGNKLRLGGKTLSLSIEEITTSEHYEAYLSLERFHYRSNPSLIEQDESKETRGGGRKAVLIASISVNNKKNYVGYIELTMPLMMVAPRHRVFDRPFKHSSREISWVKWDQNSLKRNLNLIVRISRIVTHPTYRGLKLSHMLIDSAEVFCKERWHIQARSPIFIEISAEMLNYFDFVSGCGFTYCGHSEGNQKRVAKDMLAMSRGQKITSGIMTLQKKYFGALESFADYKGYSINDAINEITEISKNEDPESVVDEASWVLLRKIFRQPRPYFIKGLDKDSKNYLKEVKIKKPDTLGVVHSLRNPKIVLKNIRVTATVNLPISRNVRVIKDAFGLDGRQIRQTLLELNEFTALQGNVFLLAGASGTGKSVFLDVLGHKDKNMQKNIALEFEEFSVPSTSSLMTIGTNQIVIDYFAEKYGLSKSLKTLAMVGLSEAVPMIKPFWMLSKGQKYRARLADLILSDKDVWLLDEFGADLDPVTASVLASKLRDIADKYGVIVFVAAANNGHFYKSLRPTRVIDFDLGVQPRFLKSMEYSNELF